ncbi:MAG: 50S ribosomal protein L24 [Thermodesulfobacteriota bacterium]|mgnify:CR=1 FL=1
MASKIRQNDKVYVLRGKDRQKVGKVKKVYKHDAQVLVEGVNMVKRHVKPNPYKNEQGGIVDKEAPIDISNVALVCDSCSERTRVGFKETNDGSKVRFCKKCNETIK